MKNEMKFGRSVVAACARSCKQIVAQLASARDAALAQFREFAAGREHTFQLALNEAEALAWETDYPQLVFPDLAEEKLRGVTNWIAHQRLVQSPALARA
jgi:hypothetical protein